MLKELEASLKPLSSQNIESELSYAYLHAVASRVGASCVASSRHEDSNGIDATVTAWGPFVGGGYRNEVDLKIQLKATVKPPKKVGSCISYPLSGIPRYDDLRADTVATPRILVVLFLPKKEDDWMVQSAGSLMIKKCAFWVSLRGAKPSSNATSETVYIPNSQRFDAAGVRKIFSTLSRGEHLAYAGRMP